MRDPWAEDITILSSENVHFGVETAGLGSRLAAATIDLTLQLLTIGLLAIASRFVLSYLPPRDSWTQWISGTINAISILVVFVILVGYYFLFEWLWDGQTPGKRWLGLRVLQVDGMPLTPWGALVRNLIRIADFLPPIYGSGALIAIMNPNNRRGGDLIAGTIVARERHDASRAVMSIGDAVDAFLAQSNAPQNPAQPLQNPAHMAQSTAGVVQSTAEPLQNPAQPLDDGDALERGRIARLINDQDRELLRDFGRRRATLKPIPRERLAHSLATNLSHKIGSAPPSAADSDAWLEQFAAFALSERG